MGKLENKIAVVTGGNSGIGLAAAELFKLEGAKVIINARNEKRLEETLAQHPNSFDDALIADVADVSHLEKFFNQIGEKHGKIDVLFLNAGVAKFAPLEAIDEDHFNSQININIKGVLFGVQKALPYLNEGASIIITSSVVNNMGMANSAVYSATKAAVRNLSRTLSAELLPKGIRVNTLSPGPIETPIFAKMGMPEEQMNEMAQGIQASVPMGRFGQPDEIAKAALYLASDDSSYVAGIDLAVDGGMVQL